jgi:hypothetical protein
VKPIRYQGKNEAGEGRAGFTDFRSSKNFGSLRSTQGTISRSCPPVCRLAPACCRCSRHERCGHPPILHRGFVFFFLIFGLFISSKYTAFLGGQPIHSPCAFCGRIAKSSPHASLHAGNLADYGLIILWEWGGILGKVFVVVGVHDSIIGIGNSQSLGARLPVDIILRACHNSKVAHLVDQGAAL